MGSFTEASMRVQYRLGVHNTWAISDSAPVAGSSYITQTESKSICQLHLSTAMILRRWKQFGGLTLWRC